MRFFGSATEHRAPKPLHVGRRPSQKAQRTVGDPGSKGRREAWKTSFALAETPSGRAIERHRRSPTRARATVGASGARRLDRDAALEPWSCNADDPEPIACAATRSRRTARRAVEERLS